MYMGVNGKEGGVVALKRHGCKDRGDELDPPVPADQYPELKQSSDILWALWEEDVESRYQSNINFFLSLSIENEQTVQIINRALAQQHSTLSSVGKIFDTYSEEGRALLGMLVIPISDLGSHVANLPRKLTLFQEARMH